MVDMEDVEGHSPKEGSKGSRRKAKRQVCRHDYIILRAFLPTDNPYSHARGLTTRTMLSWSIHIKRIPAQISCQGPKIWPMSMRLQENAV